MTVLKLVGRCPFTESTIIETEVKLKKNILVSIRHKKVYWKEVSPLIFLLSQYNLIPLNVILFIYRTQHFLF